MTYDLVVRGGLVLDGLGGDGVRADVGVRGDRVVEVGDLSSAEAARAIDATGRAVVPGFIDVHSHDDAAVLVEPTVPYKVLQGVTTEVVGTCGMGIAPHAEVVDAFTAWSPGLVDVPAWDGYEGYLARLEAEPASLNVAVLVGHGTVRGAVMGRGARRTPTPAELAGMRGLVEEGMGAGAVGLSTGLIYEPGCHARPDEILELARVAAEAGGIYTTHMRNEAEGLLDAVRESIAVCEGAGIPLEISHHKASGRANWGRVRESLALVDEARGRGLAVTLDQYPYTAGSTLLDAVVRNGALDPGGGGGIGEVEPGLVTIASAIGQADWEGRTLVAIAAELGMAPRAAADHVVTATGGTALVVLEMMHEDDVRTVLRHPCTMIGSDGVAAPGKPHPRLWGTFPRVLGRYARDESVLPFAEAVRRMTSFPAATFGLTDRGELRAGAFADLVVLDPDTVADTATYADPNRPPVGIDAVVVNGAVVALDGEHTGARPGRALRHHPGSRVPG